MSKLYKKTILTNNIFMNQIIIIKNQKYKIFFKMQLVISILGLIILAIVYFNLWLEKCQIQRISETVNKAFELQAVYIEKEEENSIIGESEYFGKIEIPKIELEYSIFNNCNEELLKILPCKFYGVNLGEKGNICIAGHNYNDSRFFGKLNRLKNGDEIHISDLNGKKFIYCVYNKYEVSPNNFECLKSIKDYELTLLTCDNVNNKRLIIKAFLEK